MVGTGGIEPPTSSVSRKRSPTELRACFMRVWARLSIGICKQRQGVTEIPTPGNQETDRASDSKGRRSLPAPL